MRIIRSIPALIALALTACSSAPAPAPMGTAPAALTAPPAVAAAAVESTDRAAPPGRVGPIDEAALVEGERSRDPFRASPPGVTPPPEDTRPRKSRRYNVEQLQLVGVVTRVAEPRAMLVDPHGKGWIVGVGDLVGRPEGKASWKVDRIRDREVVLTREDVDAMGAPAATRVLAMRQDRVASEDD